MKVRLDTVPTGTIVRIPQGESHKPLFGIVSPIRHLYRLVGKKVCPISIGSGEDFRFRFIEINDGLILIPAETMVKAISL